MKEVHVIFVRFDNFWKPTATQLEQIRSCYSPLRGVLTDRKTANAPCKGKKPLKVSDTYGEWANMVVKQHISIIQSCFLLDEVDRIDIMQSYAHDIEVHI